MGGKGSGRKFRWKAEIIPKLSMSYLDRPDDYLIIRDSPERLAESLRRIKHSTWYSVKKVILQRAKGSREEEQERLFRKLFPKEMKPTRKRKIDCS